MAVSGFSRRRTVSSLTSSATAMSRRLMLFSRITSASRLSGRLIMVATVTSAGIFCKHILQCRFRKIGFSTTVARVATGLIEALAAAAKQVREDRGVSREEIAVALIRAGNSGSVDKVRRFEKAQAFEALNDLLDAYQDATGASLSDLLDETKANLKKNG